MRLILLNIALAIVATACGGCIIYPADAPYFTGGPVRNFDDEMKDLKTALDRGAITLDEYERQKAALTSSFNGGGAGRSEPLTNRKSRVLPPSGGDAEFR